MNSSQTSPPNLSVVSSRTLGLPNIAFVGKAGAGKSTAAGLLKELGYTVHSFATPLKRVVRDIWGPDAAQDREKIQRLGVAVRGIDPDAWVNLLKVRLDPRSGPFGYVNLPSSARDPEPLAVDDLRFENEWHMLKGEGFSVVRLNAGRVDRIDRLKAGGRWQDEAQLEHDTETAVDHLTADYTIDNDGTIPELYDDLIDVILKERKHR